MSHIPSAAMPHAKAHEESDHRPASESGKAKGSRLPWAAIAAGGVLTIGGAITALLLTRRAKPAPRRRRTTRGTATTTPAKRTRAKSKTAA